MKRPVDIRLPSPALSLLPLLWLLLGCFPCCCGSEDSEETSNDGTNQKGAGADAERPTALRELETQFDKQGLLGGHKAPGLYRDAMAECSRSAQEAQCVDQVARVMTLKMGELLAKGEHTRLEDLGAALSKDVEAHPALAPAMQKVVESRLQRAEHIAAELAKMEGSTDTAALTAQLKKLRALAPTHEQVAKTELAILRIASAGELLPFLAEVERLRKQTPEPPFLSEAVKLADEKMRQVLMSRNKPIEFQGLQYKLLSAKVLKEFKNPRQGMFRIRGATLNLTEKVLTPPDGGFFVVVELEVKNNTNSLIEVAPNGGGDAGGVSLISSGGADLPSNHELGEYVTRDPLFYPVRTGASRKFKLFFTVEGASAEQLYLLVGATEGEDAKMSKMWQLF